MNINLISFFVVVLLTGVFSQDKADNYLEFGCLNDYKVFLLSGFSGKMTKEDGNLEHDYSNDYVISEPIEIDWQLLIDIDYELRYYAEFDMEMYNPIFSKAVEALHGKEVIIEGYIIPFEMEEEILTLSLNPYASCFFCGNASPASVISLYVKEKGRRYKMDDFKKFKGTLYLNHDDPDEFYYILRDVEEV